MIYNYCVPDKVCCFNAIILNNNIYQKYPAFITNVCQVFHRHICGTDVENKKHISLYIYIGISLSSNISTDICFEAYIYNAL